MKVLLWIGLIFAALVLAVALYDDPPPRAHLDFDPTPPNAVSTHVLKARSGKIALASLVDERDWETACVIKEEDYPPFILKRDFGLDATIQVRPELDEEWKDHLWKIAIVKDRSVAVYYLDNRQIGRLSKAACMPLDRAMLTYEHNEDRIFVELVDKQAN